MFAGIYGYVVKGTTGLLNFVGYYSLLAFQLGCLLVWGWALRKLYMDIKRAKDLLPNKNVFRLHAVLLVCYILLTLIATTANRIGAKKPYPSNALFIWFGVANLFSALSIPFEQLTFFLVAYLLNPFMLFQRKKRQEFRMYLFNGFINWRNFEAALIAQHPNIGEEMID